MASEEIALLVAVLALLAVVPLVVAVLVLAISLRSYERLYRLVQALLVGLITEVTPAEAGEMLKRDVLGEQPASTLEQVADPAYEPGEWPDG